MTLPSRHSISAMQKFEECPAAYRYRYVDRVEVEEPDAEPPRIGRAVHAAFERAYLRAVEEEHIGSLLTFEDEAMARLIQAWREEELDDDSDAFRDVVAAVGRTLEAREVDHRNVLGVEVEFKMDTPGGIPFIGYADLIERIDDTSLFIQDWKITRKAKSHDDVLHSFQLNNYAWAARQLWPWAETIYAAEIYPLLEEETRVRLDASTIRYGMVRFQADVEALIVEQQFPSFPGRQCEWCNYRDLCPDADRSGG